MREILFRGKRLDNGEWVEGWYCEKNCEHPFAPAKYDPSIIDSEFIIWHKVDPETVCQFTGLTDENGVKIFEHDIVGIDDTYTEIIWDEEDAKFIIDGGAASDVYESFDVISSTEVMVIGNIFDNPELMEGGVQE